MRHAGWHRGGWSLIEIVGVLSLLGVFAVLASGLFAGVARVERDSRTSQTLSTQFDHMLHRLRRDVWSATALAAPDAQRLLITTGGETVTWTFGEGVVRESGGGVQAWPELAMPWAVEAGRGHAALRVGEHVADARPAAFVLVAPVLQAEARR